MDKIDQLCNRCDAVLSGNTIKCDSICGRQFHIKCVKMSNVTFKNYEEMDNLLFVCDNCKASFCKAVNEKLCKIVSMFNIYDEQAKRNNDSLEDIKKQVCELKKSIDENGSEIKRKIENVNTVESEQMSYAQKVKASKNNAVVIVKPKKSVQKSDQTKQEIKNKIDPASIKIDKVRNMPDGGVAFECANSNMCEELKKVAVEKMGEDYIVETPELKLPMMKIIDITDDYSDEEIVHKLKKQNKEIIENAKIKVIYKTKSGPIYFSAIVEIDAESFEKCMSAGRLNIGWDHCKVFEYLNLRRCYKCWGFNHKAKSCKSDRKCKKCTGNHDFKDCRSNEVKCVNCVYAVEKLKMDIDTEHRADDRNCTVFKRRCTIERKKIQYEQ